jgi:hypothetical protein
MRLRRISRMLVAVLATSSFLAFAMAFTPGASAAESCHLTIYQPYRSDTAAATTRFSVHDCTSGIVRATAWAKLYRNGTQVTAGVVYTGYPTSDNRFSDLCWSNATYKGWGKLTVYNAAGGSGANQAFGNPTDIGCNGGLGPALSALLTVHGPLYPVDDGVGIDIVAEIP